MLSGILQNQSKLFLPIGKENKGISQTVDEAALLHPFGSTMSSPINHSNLLQKTNDLAQKMGEQILNTQGG